MSLLITPGNRDVYTDALDQYFRLRHRVFNEWLGWNLSSHDGREADQFDRDDTVYVLAFDNKGNVCGGTRLIPTTGEYMISSVFPEIWEDQEIIHDPCVWEMSRFVIDWQALANDRQLVHQKSGEVGCACAEYCVLNDIFEFVSILGVRFEERVTEVFGKPQWLSREMSLGGVPSYGAKYRISLPHIRATRQRCGLGAPVITQLAEVVNG